jgi:carboxylesterase type B
MGPSGGASSILHQIIAYGGMKPSGNLIRRAIMQSTGYEPFAGHLKQEKLFQQFLHEANASSLHDLRGLPEKTLLDANRRMIASAPYGRGNFGTNINSLAVLEETRGKQLTIEAGPAVDGAFVPDLPTSLLLQGSFNKDVDIMIGYVSNEVRLGNPAPASIFVRVNANIASSA